MPKNQFHQEEVYKRMLKLGAETWNIRDSEIGSVDPVVKLLMRGLSKEVEKVGNELKSAETRILKRMAKQLMPLEFQTVNPGHTVLHFDPSEKIELSRYDHFLFEKKWFNKEKFNRQETQEITFSPAGAFQATPDRVSYRIEKEKVFALHQLSKEHLEPSSIVTSANTIILGIDRFSKNDFMLYFDWFSEVNKKALFNALTKLRITTLTGKPIKTTFGLRIKEDNLDFFEEKLNPLMHIEKSVQNYYSNRFVEVSLKDVDSHLLSGQLSDLSDETRQELSEIDPEDECIWIQLFFPKEFDEQTINDTFIQSNCFPVVNRKMERQVFRLQPDLNIKKLEFTGYFLNVERVVTSTDIAYREDMSVKFDKLAGGTFCLRTGNIGRIDEREAQEYLTYLLDLIKEEKQAFASVDVSSTTEDLQTIDQTLKRIEQRIESSGEKHLQPYMLLVPIKNYENVYAYYWSCSGESANGINRGSTVDSKTAGISSSGNAILVDDVVGGKNDLTDTELTTKYRHALLSKGSVVTKGDIKSLCKSIGGNAIKSVEIYKEIVESFMSKKGLIRVLTVKIQFATDFDDALMKNYILQKIESELEAQSNFSIPVNILSAE